MGFTCFNLRFKLKMPVALNMLVLILKSYFVSTDLPVKENSRYLYFKISLAFVYSAFEFS